MNNRITFPLVATCATLLLSAALTAGQAQAEEAEKANPLQFYTGENGSYAKVTLEADLGFFTQGNSYFGKSEDNLGKKSDHWWESLIRPGLDVNYVLPSTQTLYGQFDVVQANTFGGIDAAASTDGDGHSLRVDHAFAGWKSGNLFSSLGEDFLDISFGRQRYTLGNGFLFASQGSASGERAAYWIGGRNSADYAGIIRMKSGNWSSDLIYFDPDLPKSRDNDTRLGGGNVEYTVEKMGNIGGGFYVMESDDPSRDSMNIYNLRAGVFPFAVAGGADALKPLHIEGEYAQENRDSGLQNGNAWYAQVSYEAEHCPWTPTLTYRYASFDENYDSLFFGSTDWETWYQGEILGEYPLDNSDLDTHMLKLKVKPIEPVAVTLAYINYNTHQTDEDFAQEYDLIIDWTVNDHLALSLVGGIATPDDAAEVKYKGDDNWSYMMMFGSIKF